MKRNKGDNMYPTPEKLNEDQINDLTSLVPPHMLRAKKLIEYVGHYPGSPSNDVSYKCSISNISDTAKDINPAIYDSGFFVGCERLNKCELTEESTNQFVWSIYKI